MRRICRRPPPSKQLLGKFHDRKLPIFGIFQLLLSALCCEWFRGNYWCAKIHARVNFAIVNWNSTRWWLWKKNMWLYRSDAYPLKSCCCSFCSQYIRMNFLSRIPLDATFRILPLWSSKKMQGNSNEEARSANALVNQSLKVASI